MKNKKTRAAWAALALACVGMSAEAATVVGVSPQGEVARVQQVAVRFSEAVVPFGDPRLPDPFTVACEGAAPEGSGRWSSDRSWLYDFRAMLPPGMRCTIKAKAGWAPSAGALTGRTEFTFSTGGPAIVSMTPGSRSTIVEDQSFLMRLNGPVVEASVVANAWCEVEGIGERLPLQIIGGAVRDEVLKARRIDKDTAARTLLTRCDRPLPNLAAVRVIWGRGIASAANPQVTTTVEQRYRYEVRAAFTADFSCEREKATAPCLPIRPMTVRFSAPVPRALITQVRLVPPSGPAIEPLFDKDDKRAEFSELTFPTPLSENTSYSVAMPPGLKDNADRPLANAASFPLKVATGNAPPIAKFAAAPFGIVERNADAMLPITLRHVQADLRPGKAPAAASGASAAAAGPTGQIRDKLLVSDADIFAWYVKVQRFHETRMTAEQLGYPKSTWRTTEESVDDKGRKVRNTVDRVIQTRELSLLASEPGVKRLVLPQLEGGDPRPFEVVGIPLAEAGYHVVELESLRLGQSLLDKRAPMYVRTGVLVTNLGVHFKQGRENSLVWVTTLDRGKPVEGAIATVNDCRGQPIWSGPTDAKGIAVVSRALDADMQHCPADQGYFVTAHVADAKGTGGDVAFVFSSWQKGIEAWRFNVPTGRGALPDMRASTVFDRTLLRAGETVSMKHFVRIETMGSLAAVPPERLPNRVKIVHEGSGQEFVFPLQWSANGSAVTTWSIPPAAKLGQYDVVLERVPPGSEKPAGAGDTGTDTDTDTDNESEPSNNEHTWTSGNFRVEEFRLPLVDARVSGPKGAAVAPASLPIAVQMNFFSGGPMAGAPLKASALLKPRSPSFDGYDEFSFEPPRDPKRSEQQNEENEEASDTSAPSGKIVADKIALSTDKAGAATFVLKDLPKTVRPMQIDAEVDFADPNGETQTVGTRIDLWPSAVVVGVKAGSWASNRGHSKFTVVALDTAGKPLKGQAIAVRGRITETLTTRKRIVGGFYAYDNRTEVKDLGPLCSGTTDDHGLLACEASFDTAGQVDVIAEAKDAQGNPAVAAASIWITRQGELWFSQDNDDRIDVLPEKKRYEPGETARLQVRMPFREATALVSVEREGIIATQVVTLRGDDPTVELKIEPGWGPNVFVSVLALRGRIRETPWYSLFTWGWKEPLAWWHSFWGDSKEYQAPTAMVDLAKPAFKLGVAALKVSAAANALQVSVTTDKPQYTVRQKALAHIRVTQFGQPVANADVAFAAVDEGLLALRDNDSWDLLGAMIKERAWGVETSTAQSEIIGRRHYGRKAVAAGGGGGVGATRELFDTLLVWKATVPLDANGEATVEVPLNDSLTSFRLVAVASAGVLRFGTGKTDIRVSQDLQLLGGLPPLVRDGDRFGAMLTLRNTTQREMKVHATLQGTANLPGPNGASAGPDILHLPIALPAQDVTLAAGAAQELVWPVDVPADAFSITWEAAAEEASAKDRLKVTQLVAAAVPVRVLQATLTQLDGTVTLPVAAPADALPASGPKRGGLAVALQPKLTGALPGMRRFFETYPFICLEQKTSKSVGLKDAQMWAGIANTLPTYLDSDGLASYFPPRDSDAASGSDTLTAYVLAATNEAGFALPAEPRDAMLAGLAGFVEGRIQRKFWSPRADLDVRKLHAIEALSRYGKAEPKMLGSINITPNLWPTAAVIDWLSILKRVDGIPERPARLAEANQILRARLTYSGTTLKFSTEEGDFWWWLMDSADANAARLILAVIDDPAWKDDLPKMVVGSLSRQRRGAWLTTTANLWGSLALDKFAAKFESVPIAGRTTAGIDAGARKVAVDWSTQAGGGSLLVPWPAASGTLSVAQEGAGKPWLTVQSLAAIPLKAPFSSGYTVSRSVVPVQQKDKGRWSRGDVMRIHIEIDAQADMTWVVVADPVPGGATVLGTGLGRDSQLATRGEKQGGDAWPAFEERSFAAYRGYYEYMPRGKHVIEYTVRLNNLGRFALPPTRVEAMYAPDAFGEAPNASLEVAP